MREFIKRSLLGLTIALCSSSAAMAQDSTFAVSKTGVNLLRLNDDAGLVVRGTAGAGAIAAEGAGVRFLWYPGKWALRAGKVESFGATYWDNTNVGNGSVALGENVRASGDNSFAANLATTASGDLHRAPRALVVHPEQPVADEQVA